MQTSTAIRNYLVHTTGIQLGFLTDQNFDILPLYLLHRFEMVEGTLFNKSVIFAIDKGLVKLTPYDIKRSLETIFNKLMKPVIYCTPAISSTERNRLMQYGVQFIIIGKQMYLPEFLIAIEDRVEKSARKDEPFAPATQFAFLYLLNNSPVETTMEGLAEKLNYSKMTVTRIFDELNDKGIFTAFNSGRRRLLRYSEDRKTAWEQGKKYLINPVTDTKFINLNTQRLKDEFLESGITALSHLSMLSDDAKKTIACSRDSFQRLLSENRIIIIDFEEDAERKLEIWRYDPKKLSSEAIIDKFSIYAILKDNPDERVQQALSRMIEEIKW